jgi:glycosyltransferase involved in cell wall biosynthesis
MLEDTAIVAIARNEGERLKRCLRSCAGVTRHLIFSDSGSTDGSADWARMQGVEVVDLERPWNQPRGRNAGFRRLLEIAPDVKYVFFIDGDCQLIPGFIEAAHALIERDSKLGALCGRRLEEHPQASIYNRLTHMEWNTVVGSEEGGGDMLVRVDALRALGGYRESMVSGEDVELSHRLKKSGWRVLRVDLDMTRHDVAIHRFASWWKRTARGGYSFTHAALLNWGPPEWYKVRQIWSILLWGIVIPLAALALVPFTSGASLLAYLLLLAALWFRVRRWRMRALKDSAADASLYALYLLIGKFPETQGVISCAWRHFRGRSFRYVEYKDYQKPG